MQQGSLEDFKLENGLAVLCSRALTFVERVCEVFGELDDSDDVADAAECYWDFGRKR